MDSGPFVWLNGSGRGVIFWLVRVLLGVVVALVVLGAEPVLADAQTWSVQGVPVPVGAANSELTGVSCPDPSACVAVGTYSTTTGKVAPFAEVWDGSSWTEQILPSPSNNAELTAVSCTSTSACTATGYQVLPQGPPCCGSDQLLAFADRWDGQSWTIQSTPNPRQDVVLSGCSNLTSNLLTLCSERLVLSSVSCTTTTACTAVGDSIASPAATTEPDSPLAEGWNGQAWRLQTTAPGSGPLFGVSCTAAKACIGVSADVAEVWKGEVWQPQDTPLPPHGGSFSGVSCTTAEACTAVGSYVTGSDTYGNTGGTFAERWNGHSWNPQSLTNPGSDSRLHAVSCPTTSACTAVGTYETAGITSTLADQWNGTNWSSETPPNPQPSDDILFSVSCASPNVCTAVGMADGLPLIERST